MDNANDPFRQMEAEFAAKEAELAAKEEKLDKTLTTFVRQGWVQHSAGDLIWNPWAIYPNYDSPIKAWVFSRMEQDTTLYHWQAQCGEEIEVGEATSQGESRDSAEQHLVRWLRERSTA